MKQLRTSSTLYLHHYIGNPRADVSDYMKRGILFNKKCGFDAIDLPLNLINFNEGDWKPYIDNAMKVADEAGIKIELCHLPYGTKVYSQPEKMPEFSQGVLAGIDAAAYLGVDYAVLHPNTVTLPMTEYDHKAQFKSVVEHIAPLAEHAQKVGVKIVVENTRFVPSHIPSHRYCQNADELCEVADALGIGICWDFGHANIGDFKQSEALEYVGSRLKVIHVNDNLGVGDDHVPPFLGTVDWKDAMKGLDSIGFDGLFNFEVVSRRVPEGVGDAYGRFLIEIARELMSY